jgi:hypothetical protein
MTVALIIGSAVLAINALTLFGGFTRGRKRQQDPIGYRSERHSRYLSA